MIFEALYESARQGELLLIDGGYCRWHLRKDGSITIYEMLSVRCGAGREMLMQLQAYGKPIQARCPADLPANEWYRKRGFVLLRTEQTRSGREVNLWWLEKQEKC
jgi:hypothetical protein